MARETRRVVDLTPPREPDVIALAEVSPLLGRRSRPGQVARAGVPAPEGASLSSEADGQTDMDARMERLLARQEADARQASVLVCRGCLGTFRPPSYAARPRPLAGEEQTAQRDTAQERAVARTGAVPDRLRAPAPGEPAPALPAIEPTPGTPLTQTEPETGS